MSLVFDHAFVFTAPGAPVGSRVRAAGFVEGSPNTHPGQGTANRRFFFCNGMLELLYVADADEAQSPLVARTGLWERSQFRANASCPIGIAVRSAANDTLEGLFATWDYCPPYLPANQVIPVATTSQDVSGPLVFVSPGGGGATEACDPRSLTRLELVLPARVRPSEALQSLVDSRVVTLATGTEPLLAAQIDHGRLGQCLDLRPAASLVLRW